MKSITWIDYLAGHEAHCRPSSVGLRGALHPLRDSINRIELLLHTVMRQDTAGNPFDLFPQPEPAPPENIHE